MADSIQSVYYGLQDVQGDLSRQVDTLEYDDGRLDEVEKRLELISQLERKYGADLKAVIAYGAKADAELASMTANDADEEGLEKRVTAEHQALLKLGAQLRSARKHAANQLISAIHGQLKALYMEKKLSFRCGLASCRLTRCGRMALTTWSFTFRPTQARPLSH